MVKANDASYLSDANLIWDEIKDALILHCSHKGNKLTLINDLYCLIQNPLALKAFYGKATEIKIALFKLIETNESELLLIRTKKEVFAKTCLNIFLSGINEPLGSTIGAMKLKVLQMGNLLPKK